MKKTYDLVFLTNTPSFYKLNLCNEIARTHSLLLVLYGYGAEAVNTELTEDNCWRFDFAFINEGDSNTRNRLATFIRLMRLMHRVRAKRILYTGWLAPEYNLYSFVSPKRKNVLVCESSKFDVSFAGVAGWIKRRIIRRMSCVLPSGEPHAELFRRLGYPEKIHITGGVGIFRKPPKRITKPNIPLRYLYVGRLVEVKNIQLLIQEFNRNGKSLTIVGEGILETKLKSLAAPNIAFTGFIANDRLGEVYQSHDVFILPSKSEPWGLVVEEAIYWGLPVIVSDRVGCSIDMVEALGTGRIFESGSPESLHRAVEEMELNYERYKKAVDAVDFDTRDCRQVAAYNALLEP